MVKNMNKLFKYLLLIIIVLYSLFIILPYFWHYLYKDEVLTAMEWNGWGSLIPTNGLLAWSLAIINYIALIGLLLYKKWARTLFLVLTLGAGLIIPAFGLMVTTGLDSIIGYYITIGYGVIVTMSYFTSVSNEFNAESRNQGVRLLESGTA